MKKFGFVFALLMVFVVALSACSTYLTKSVTYHIDNGDVISISVDAKKGYDLSEEVPFSVTKDEEELAFGTFIALDYYDVYRETVDLDDAATLVDEGEKDGNEYFYYTVDGAAGMEHNYIVKVSGADTAVVLGSLASEDAAKAMFDSMTIVLEK